MSRYYTGIGARLTPASICDIAKKIGCKLAQQGVILRTSGVLGIDSAFDVGRITGQGVKECIYPYECTQEGLSLAASLHPNWKGTQPYDRTIHAATAHLVAGLELNLPSTCLITWTKDGCISHQTRTEETGYVGTAISVAEHFRVPIYNLNLPEHLKIWVDWLNKEIQ